MFNKNKRAKKFSDLLIPGIILIIIGIVFAFQGIRDYSKLNGDLLNLNTASEKDLDADKYVEIDVDYAFYSFCENVETTNYVFKRTTDQYYLISALKDNEYYIGLNIAESKKSELEALSDYTWSQSGADPGTLHYIGKLCKSDSEIMGYMRNYIYDMYESAYDITLTSTEKATLDSYMLPYYIKRGMPYIYHYWSCSSRSWYPAHYIRYYPSQEHCIRSGYPARTIYRCIWQSNNS